MPLAAGTQLGNTDHGGPRDQGLVLVDVATARKRTISATADTGARQPLLPVRGYALGRSVGASRDGRWITYTETGTEGDIWIATLGKP